MKKRMPHATGTVSSIPMRLSILVIVMLAVALGALPGTFKTVQADELDMDAINEQALQTLATSGIKVKQIALGMMNGAAVTVDGDLYTWGQSTLAGFADGDVFKDYTTPQKVESLSHVTEVALSTYRAAAITEDGSLYTWGSNGWLGDEAVGSRLTPGKVPGISNAVSVSLGEDHGAILTKKGEVYTWGQNDAGQLGLGEDKWDKGRGSERTPQKVEGISRVREISLGNDFSAAITENGDLYTWGSDCYGQLGDGDYTPEEDASKVAPAPRKVKTLSNVPMRSLKGLSLARITIATNIIMEMLPKAFTV